MLAESISCVKASPSLFLFFFSSPSLNFNEGEVEAPIRAQEVDETTRRQIEGSAEGIAAPVPLPLFFFPLSLTFFCGWYNLADYKTPLPCASPLSVPGWSYWSDAPEEYESVSEEREKKRGRQKVWVTEKERGKKKETASGRQKDTIDTTVYSERRGKCQKHAHLLTNKHSYTHMFISFAYTISVHFLIHDTPQAFCAWKLSELQ